MKADTVVIRHPHAGAPYFLAQKLDCSVINAGDGMHAHPTQGLLDIHTIIKHLGSLEGKKVTIVGDILYSRVARTNLWALTKMGAKVVLCGPRTLIPPDFLNNARNTEGHPFASIEVEGDLNLAIRDADVVMALRIQRERQRSRHLPSLLEYSRMYGITSQRMRHASPDALVMHPGPINEGIEIDSDVAHGARSLIEYQVTAGVAIRMALLCSASAEQEPKDQGYI